MPSKGTPRVTIRIPPEILAAMDASIAVRNKIMAHDREWDRTDWIMAAITDKLSHIIRCRGKKGRVTATKTDENEPREVGGALEELWEPLALDTQPCPACGSSDGLRCQCERHRQ